MERGRARPHGCEQGNRDGGCRKMSEKGVSEPMSGGVWGRGRAALWKWGVRKIGRVVEGSGASSSPCPQERECALGGKHACAMGWSTTHRCGMREEAAGGGVGNS